MKSKSAKKARERKPVTYKQLIISFFIFACVLTVAIPVISRLYKERLEAVDVQRALTIEQAIEEYCSENGLTSGDVLLADALKYCDVKTVVLEPKRDNFSFYYSELDGSVLCSQTQPQNRIELPKNLRFENADFKVNIDYISSEK